jgi:hypothetical protein
MVESQIKEGHCLAVEGFASHGPDLPGACDKLRLEGPPVGYSCALTFGDGVEALCELCLRVPIEEQVDEAYWVLLMVFLG